MSNLFKFNAPLTKNTRRWLIVVALFALILYLVLGLFGQRFFLVGLLPFTLYWLLLGRLNRSTSRIAKEKDKNLDERQRSRRNRAYRLAYQVVVYLLLLTLLLDFFGPGAFQITFYNANSSVTSFLLLADVLLIAFLPTMYVAWLEPDPIQEETAYSVQKGSAT